MLEFFLFSLDYVSYVIALCSYSFVIYLLLLYAAYLIQNKPLYIVFLSVIIGNFIIFWNKNKTFLKDINSHPANTILNLIVLSALAAFFIGVYTGHIKIPKKYYSLEDRKYFYALGLLAGYAVYLLFDILFN